ncbi:hypothetical protein ACB098_12G071800 [Castanea mollissima]
MSRRPGNHARRLGDNGGLFSSSKSRSSPLLSLGLIVVGGLLFIAYSYRNSGGFGNNLDTTSRVEGDYSCTAEVHRALPILKKAYGDSMHKVLHVGPDTCSVVSKLLKEEETAAWGVEPYDIEDADSSCRALVHKGIITYLQDTSTRPFLIWQEYQLMVLWYLQAILVIRGLKFPTCPNSEERLN